MQDVPSSMVELRNKNVELIKQIEVCWVITTYSYYAYRLYVLQCGYDILVITRVQGKAKAKGEC